MLKRKDDGLKAMLRSAFGIKKPTPIKQTPPPKLNQSFIKKPAPVKTARVFGKEY